MSLQVGDSQAHQASSAEDVVAASIAPVIDETSKTQSESGTNKEKRHIETFPFHYQFSEVEKAIANFTKHQPFNHHYAPNVNVNNGSINNDNRGHHHNHNNNYNRSHNNHNNHNYHNGHHNHNGNSRLQPQTFTMNAQLKQQQQQQFLSSAAQQISNRYKSASVMKNGNMNHMVNVNNNLALNGMNQAPQMNQMGQMHQMSSFGQMGNMGNASGMNGLSGMNAISGINSSISQIQQQYVNTQYQQPSLSQQQVPHQSTLQLNNGFMSGPDLKFDSFAQNQPHHEYIAPLRNTSPQFSAPLGPGSVGAFGSPLEQINSNSSFGMGGVDAMHAPMTTVSSSGVADYGDNKLSLDETTYLGDIWGSGKGLRNSASVWA